MSYSALKKFNNAGFIVYALPAHTSGKTQPLDVAAFSCFKADLNRSAALVVETGYEEFHTNFQFCALQLNAFLSSMTPKNIVLYLLVLAFWSYMHRFTHIIVGSDSELFDKYNLHSQHRLDDIYTVIRR